jgi:cytochrome c-type biogenesis protein CcmH
MTDKISALKQQILQLDELRQSGALSAETAATSRAALEWQLVEAVLTSQPSASAAPARGAANSAKAALAPPAEAAPRPSRGLVLGLTAFVVLFGAVGYAWRGSSEGWKTAPGMSGETAADGTQQISQAQIEAMVNGLAEKLKGKPDDAEGWLMLGRSYAALGRYDDAIPAFRKVLSLQAKNAQAMADLADALAMTQQRSFKGEPASLIAQALKADPDNLKALALGGTLAYENRDLTGAIKLWEHAVKIGPADNDLVRQLNENIDAVRKMAGLPGEAAPTAPVAQTAATDAAPFATASSLSGQVSLAPALAAKAAPDDTVFIFARPAEGSRMPLAILKKQVKDLPLNFTLDDSMAMSPAAKISGAKAIVVGARVSKSGQAMTQPGDLQGQSAVVQPGATGLKISIAEEVR